MMALPAFRRSELCSRSFCAIPVREQSSLLQQYRAFQAEVTP
ncbi:Uncharacterised protein [Ectopseudomonas mendocina]|uniref:Uncharacterized protein n=1 Tax=Ectopseudomonas mendocina TaxID=300 RepID=A0A379IXI8_ECTME|nr:Uncharacterised protein [Pseudomonas mendocina]